MPSRLGQSAVRPLVAAVLILLGLGLIELGVLALHRGSVRGDLGSSSTTLPGALPALICDPLDCSSSPVTTPSKPSSLTATQAGPPIRVAAIRPLADVVVAPAGSRSSMRSLTESVGGGDRRLGGSQLPHKNRGQSGHHHLTQNLKNKIHNSSSKQRDYEASSGRSDRVRD